MIRFRLITLLLVMWICSCLVSLVLRAREVADLTERLSKMTVERDYFEREYNRLSFTRWPEKYPNGMPK